MKHHLNQLCHQYKTARGILGSLNVVRAGPAQKGRIMTRMNKLRLQLKNEIERVSWLVWPETGRPYNGGWKVMSEVTSVTMFRGSMIQCVEFKDNSSYGNYYHIVKWDSV